MKKLHKLLLCGTVMSFAANAAAQISTTPGLNEIRYGGRSVDGNWYNTQEQFDRVVPAPYAANAWGDWAGDDTHYANDYWPPPNGGWGDNTTFYYSGYIFIPAGSNTVTFACSFDDSKRLCIDGKEAFRNAAWNSTAEKTLTLETGWHAFDLWVDNGGNGFGPPDSDQWGAPLWHPDRLGFGIDWNGGPASAPANFVFPEDVNGERFSTEFPPDAVLFGGGAMLTQVDAASATLEIPVVTGTNATTTLRLYYSLDDDVDADSPFADYPAPVTASGTYAVTLTGLVADTDYVCRFATVDANNVPTFALDTVALVTVDALPAEFGAPSASRIQKASATLVGEMTTGYPAVRVTACLNAVDLGTDSLPEDWAQTVDAGEWLMTGALSATFSGLIAATDYVVRFYGVNTAGAVWSEPVAFTTENPAISSRDQYRRVGGEGDIVEIVVPITLDTPAGKPVSFRWYTAQATDANGENAVPDVHYVDDAALIVIPPGTTATNFTVTVMGNNRDEFPGKHFWIGFDSATNAVAPGTVEIGTLTGFGKRIFFDDFSNGNAQGWTWTGAWGIGGGSLNYSHVDHGGNAFAGKEEWASYGVRAMGRVGNTWKNWAIRAYDTTASGGGWYEFRLFNNHESGLYYSTLSKNGEHITNGGNTGGTRLGFVSVLRPCAVRVNRLSDGSNRVRCWAGYQKVIDWIDADAPLPGGRIGVSGSAWADYITIDDVEVFMSFPSVFIVR